MATTERLMAGVSPRQVFDVLRDGYSYGEWVVGTRAIRSADADWPAQGTRIHYTVGYGPVRKDDETKVLAYEPDQRLELEAQAWPVGTALVTITAEPEGESTRVRIDERPGGGPALLVHNPLFAAAIKARNVETLRRLERIATRR